MKSLLYKFGIIILLMMPLKASCLPTYFGDVDNDGDIDCDDLNAQTSMLLARQPASLLGYNCDAADVNQDNRIDITDITLLVQLLNDPSFDRVPDTLCVENDAVKEYLANTTATLTATQGNYTESFFEASRDYRPDQPGMKTIAFDATSASQATLTMATDPFYRNVVLSADVKGATGYTLRNFVPGVHYYYRVVADGQTLLHGALYITGQLRMIAIDSSFNIRDLGGWTGLEGNKVRYEKIYRGGSLGGMNCLGSTGSITDEDRAELYRIGLRAHLDLRAKQNVGKYLLRLSTNAYALDRTTLQGADFNNTMADYGAYNEDATLVNCLAWVIYELKQGHPVYFNCQMGADRTGAVAFIIEGLLGCYGDDTGRQLAMDYELTGFSQSHAVDFLLMGDPYRSATNMSTVTEKVFYQIIHLTSDKAELNTLQERCYYYLNQYWEDTRIDRADLDWFINYMLQTDTYTHPSWAVTAGDLKTLSEKAANVVTYVSEGKE